MPLSSTRQYTHKQDVGKAFVARHSFSRPGISQRRLTAVSDRGMIVGAVSRGQSAACSHQSMKEHGTWLRIARCAERPIVWLGRSDWRMRSVCSPDRRCTNAILSNLLILVQTELAVKVQQAASQR